MVRKNLRNEGGKRCQSPGDERGVDLNRNYDFAWGIDE